MVISDSGRLLLGGTFTDVVTYSFSAGSSSFYLRYHDSLCSSSGYASISTSGSVNCANDGLTEVGGVNAIAQAGGHLILARENDSFWGIDGHLVDVIATDDKSIFIAGQFNIAGGYDRLRLASFDGQGFLNDWAPGANSTVRAMVKKDGVIYTGGDFTLSGDGIGSTSRNRLAAFDEVGNLLSWDPSIANASVNALDVTSDAIYVGGSFTAAASNSRRRLAAFDVYGALLPWKPGADDTVSSLYASDGLIYAGGNFTAVGGGTGVVARNHLAAFDFSANVAPWEGSTNGPVSSITEANGIIYASGEFSVAGGGTGSAARNRLAAFDVNGSLTNWAPGLSDGEANSMLISNGLIYAGGTFSAAGGGVGNSPRSGLAAFTLSGALSAWEPKTNGAAINSIVLGGDDLYIGGDFTSATDDLRTVTRSRMSAFDVNGLLLDR
jgi:hypothetical protein